MSIGLPLLGETWYNILASARACRRFTKFLESEPPSEGSSSREAISNRVRGLLVVALQARKRRRPSTRDVFGQSVTRFRLGESPETSESATTGTCGKDDEDRLVLWTRYDNKMSQS